MDGTVLDPEQYKELVTDGSPTGPAPSAQVIPFPTAVHVHGGGIFACTPASAQYNSQGVFIVGQWAESVNEEVGWYNVSGPLEVNLFPYTSIQRVEFNDGGLLSKIEEEGSDAIPE